MKIPVFVLAVIVILSCYYPWVIIDSKNLTITGMDTTGTKFGKPAYLHLILISISLFCVMIGNSIVKKIAVFFAAINLAWAVRNYGLISACYMGECPDKQPALYILLLGSFLLLIAIVLSNKKATTPESPKL